MTGTAKPPFDGKAFARGLSTAPGVYRMYAGDDAVLYVGKAGALRKRVASYFSSRPQSPRTTAMLAQVARMEVTVTRTEAEALLLENQLIKSLKPRYNVLLRDDKSYPYVLLTQEDWPRLALHRGGRAIRRTLFRPLSPAPARCARRSTSCTSCSACAAARTACSGTAPGPASSTRSAAAARRASGWSRASATPKRFGAPSCSWKGAATSCPRTWSRRWQQASDRLDFEEAARIRDLIATIRQLQARQYVDGRAADLDVLACAMQGAHACVLLLAFRDGRNLGTRAFFPRTNGADSAAEVLAAFVSQYYGEQPAPGEIVLDRDIEEREMLQEALVGCRRQACAVAAQRARRARRLLDMARRNAELALATELASQASAASAAGIAARIAGRSRSRRSGSSASTSATPWARRPSPRAWCSTRMAPRRGQYRRYNIAGIEPGDDYAAMHQALERRFRRAVQDDGVLPDLLLIDGGAGQVAQARAVLADLGIDRVVVVGVAKGEARRAGHEALLMPDGRELRPGAQSPALQLVQQIRDEAHRFAITGHRGRRQKAREQQPAGGHPRHRAAQTR